MTLLLYTEALIGTLIANIGRKATSKLIDYLGAEPESPSDLRKYEIQIRQEIVTTLRKSETRLRTTMNDLLRQNKKQHYGKFDQLVRRLSRTRDEVQNASLDVAHLSMSKEKPILASMILVDVASYYRGLVFGRVIRHICNQLDFQRVNEVESLLTEAEEFLFRFEETWELRDPIKAGQTIVNQLEHLPVDEKGSFIKAIAVMQKTGKDECLRFLNESKVKELKKPRLFRAEYYSNLAETLWELGMELQDGGKTQVADLVATMRRTEPNIDFSIEDAEKALDYLEKKGWIAGILTDAMGVKYVQFTGPFADISKIVKVAKQKGYTTIEEVLAETELDVQRITIAFNHLEELKIVRRVSDYPEGVRFYFPGLGGQ